MRQAVYFDNNPDAKSELVGSLEKGLGVSIRFVVPQSLDEVIRLSSEHDVVLVDLRNLLPEANGLDAIRAVLAEHPDRVFVAISGHLNDPRYANIERRVLPGARVVSLAKSDIDAGRRSPKNVMRGFREQFEQVLKDSESWPDLELLRDPMLMEDLSLPADDYLILGPEQKLARARRVSLSCRKFFDPYFSNGIADWVVLGSVPGLVLEWGLGPHPSDNHMWKLASAAKSGAPVLLAGEVTVDQIHSAPGVEWLQCGTHRAYPSMLIKFLDGAPPVKDYEFLFDTGSDRNYIDLAIGTREDLIPFDALSRELKRSFGGYSVSLVGFELVTRLAILDGTQSTASVQSSVFFVESWDGVFGLSCTTCESEGPVCGRRRGLLSTVLLVDGGVSIILEGSSGKLRVIQADALA